jgi:hypothetical protein
LGDVSETNARLLIRAMMMDGNLYREVSVTELAAGDFRYFERSEFTCKETGENGIKDSFLYFMDNVRHDSGFSFRINSGFRGAQHSKERDKTGGPGQHNKGECCDVAVANATQRMRVVAMAIKHGARGIGVADTFVHIDRRVGTPKMWVY